MIGPIVQAHHAGLVQLVHNTREFTPEERVVALELLGAALAGGADYVALVDEDHGKVRGYVCYGPTPMTDGTWDLYWIAVDEASRSHGVGRSLVTAMLADLRKRAARLVRVETSGQESYARSRVFYERSGFEALARVRDFYKRGDDLVVYGRYL